MAGRESRAVIQYRYSGPGGALGGEECAGEGEQCRFLSKLGGEVQAVSQEEEEDYKMTFR